MDVHATLPGGVVEQVLRQLRLQGRTVLDLGYGGGDLARMALAAGAARVVGIEIDAVDVDLDPRVRVVPADLGMKGVEFWFPVDACVVMAPPYALFERCLTLVERYEDVWTLCPPRHVDLALRLGLRRVGEVGGDAFHPPATGRHHLLARGPFAAALVAP